MSENCRGISMTTQLYNGTVVFEKLQVYILDVALFCSQQCTGNVHFCHIAFRLYHLKVEENVNMLVLNIQHLKGTI